MHQAESCAVTFQITLVPKGTHQGEERHQVDLLLVPCRSLQVCRFLRSQAAGGQAAEVRGRLRLPVHALPAAAGLCQQPRQEVPPVSLACDALTALQPCPILSRLICEAPSRGDRKGRRMAVGCLQVFVVISSAYSTAVCWAPPSHASAGEFLWSPPCCKLLVWQATSSMQLASRLCLSINLQRNKSPPPGFGLQACFSSRLTGAAGDPFRVRE